MADFPILSPIIPKTGIKVSFFDNDGKKVSGVTVDKANQVAKQNPDKKFYFPRTLSQALADRDSQNYRIIRR